MATTPVEFEAPSGMTLTVELYPYGSDTIANTGGDTATEATNRKGLYSASITESTSGWHTLHILDGSSNLIGTYAVYMEDDTDIHRAEDSPARMYDGLAHVARVGIADTVTDGAKSATALTNVTWTDAKAGYIDVAITSRAVAGDEMNLADDAITAAKHDETTAWPVDASLRQTLFSNDMVYLDTVDGTASTAWPYGTPTYPTSTMANAKTIADANTLQQINVRGAATLAAAMEGYSFVGYGQYDVAGVFNVGGYSVAKSTFESMLIAGASGSGASVNAQARYLDCYLLTHTNINGAALECAVDGATSIVDGGHAWFRNALFGLKTACTLTVNAPLVCKIENPAGELTLAGQDGGVVNVWACKGFVLTINNTCTAGTINVYGPVTLTDNNGGTTVNIIPDPDGLADGVIKAASYDESTAYPVTSEDTGTTQIARTGADGDTLENISDEVAAVKTDTGNLVMRIPAALFTGITSMAQWLGLLAGKQTANATALTEIKATGAGSGTYSATTDSQEAIRDNQSAGGGATAQEVWEYGTRDLSSGAIVAATFANNAITNDVLATAAISSGTLATDCIGASELATTAVAEIADGVWDEAQAGHVTAGTFGLYLDAKVSNATGANISINPIQSSTQNSGQQNASYLTAYQHTNTSISFSVVDADDSPIDVSSVPLTFMAWVQGATGTKIIEVSTAGGSITISGDDDNVVNVALTTTETAVAYSSLQWRTVGTSNSIQYATGYLDINEAPA